MNKLSRGYKYKEYWVDTIDLDVYDNPHSPHSSDNLREIKILHVIDKDAYDLAVTALKYIAEREDDMKSSPKNIAICALHSMGFDVEGANDI